MTNADKGFFLSYLGDPLSKTAHGRVGREWERIQSEGLKRYALPGAAGGAVGYGISAIWGKLSDKPDTRRDLFMALAGGVGGVAGDAASGFRDMWKRPHKHAADEYQQKNSYKEAQSGVTMEEARKLHAEAKAVKEETRFQNAAWKKLRQLQSVSERLELAGVGGDPSQEGKNKPGSSIWDKIDAAKNRIRGKIDAAKNEISGQIKRPDPFGIHRDQWETGLVGGAVGAVTGGGLSAIYGKLADNPSIRRDLVMTILGGAAGVGAGMQAHRLPWKKSTKV